MNTKVQAPRYCGWGEYMTQWMHEESQAQDFSLNSHLSLMVIWPPGHWKMTSLRYSNLLLVPVAPWLISSQ